MHANDLALNRLNCHCLTWWLRPSPSLLWWGEKGVASEGDPVVRGGMGSKWPVGPRAQGRGKLAFPFCRARPASAQL